MAGKAISDSDDRRRDIKADYDLNKNCAKTGKFIYLAYKKTTAAGNYVIGNIAGASRGKATEGTIPPAEFETVRKYGAFTPADFERCAGCMYVKLKSSKGRQRSND